MSVQTKFTPTPEQLAIGNALALGGNMAIDAGAGTGKSSTLLYLVREHIPRNQGVLMCVFNKRNQEELQEKILKSGAQKASAKTFAGMAYAAFWKRYPNGLKAGDFPDTYKYRQLARWWVVKNLPADRTPEMLKEAAKFLQDIVTYFMVNTTRDHRTGELVLFIGGSLNDEDSCVPHSLAAAHLIALAYGFDLDYSDEEGKTTPEVERMVIEDVQAIMERGLEHVIALGRMAFHDPAAVAQDLRDGEGKLIHDGLDIGNGWVDFLDMMYWCVVEGWRVWQSPFVLVDEAQDLSPLERALVDMHVAKVGQFFKQPGRVIIVGDPQQAINAFKGADNDGFTNSIIFWGVKEEAVKPLSVCWRCFREIVELAAQWKEGFTPAPNAKSGIIAEIHDDDLIKLLKDGDAIISRLRSATVIWWRKLVKAGIACKILGQNPAESVIRLLEKISSFEGFKFSELVEQIKTYHKNQLEKLTKKNAGESAIAALKDEIDTVLAMVEDVEARSMDELIDKIRKELDPRNMPKNGVSIMTGHGSKGGEWAKVFNVTPDLFPMSHSDQSPAAYIQEKNLQYVVQTRSMEAYFLVSVKHKPYDPNKPVTITVTKPEPLLLAAGDDYDDFEGDYYEDEVDEGFELSPEDLDRIGSQHGVTLDVALPAPKDAPVLLEMDPLPVGEPEPVLLTFSPKGEKQPTALLPMDDETIEAQADNPDFRNHQEAAYTQITETKMVPVEPEPIAPVVIDGPKTFRVTGDLSKDMKAATSNAQERLFSSLSRLKLKEAIALRELLDQVIDDLQADAEPV